MTPSQHAARLREWIKDRHRLAEQYASIQQVEAANKLFDILQSAEAGAEALEVTHKIECLLENDDCQELSLDERVAGLVRSVEKLMVGYDKASKAQGRWRIVQFRGVPYFIPVDKQRDWDAFLGDAEPGEHTEILPEWAVRVPPGVVITGWERP